MHRWMWAIIFFLNLSLLCAAPLPKADPKRVWVGKSVVLKSNGTMMTVSNQGTAERVQVMIINPVVVSEDEETIDIHVHGQTGRLKKSDVVRTDDGIDYFTRKLDEQITVDMLVRRASVYRLRYEFDSALSDYDAALIIQRGAALLQNRGALHLTRRDYDKAIADFSESIQILPSFQGGYRSRAAAYENLNMFDEAIKDYEKAAELGTDASVVLGIGRVLALKQQYTEAIEKYSEAININDRFTQAYTSRGTAYFELKETKKAIEDLDKAIELAPMSASGFISRAWLRLKLGDARGAYTDSSEALRLDDTDPAAINMRAWVLSTCPDEDYRNGKKAIELARKAVRITEAKNPMYLDTLACAHAEVGDFEEAVKVQTTALELKKQIHRKRFDEMKSRLQLFESKKPFREAAVSPVSK